MNLLKIFKRKKPIIFIGVRNCIDMVQHTVEDCGYEVVGILDKYYIDSHKEYRGIPIIGSEDWLLDPNNKQAQAWRKYDFALTSWHTGAQYLGRFGLDEETVRRERTNLLKQANVKTPAIIHPSVNFRGRRENVQIGKGTIIQSDCTFGPRITIGEYCFLDWSCSIYADTVIGNNVIVGTQSNLGHVTIGDNVRVGALARITPLGERQGGHMTIGDNSVVWLGALAYKDIPADSLWSKNDRILTKNFLTKGSDED